MRNVRVLLQHGDVCGIRGEPERLLPHEHRHEGRECDRGPICWIESCKTRPSEVGDRAAACQGPEDYEPRYAEEKLDAPHPEIECERVVWKVAVGVGCIVADDDGQSREAPQRVQLAEPVLLHRDSPGFFLSV